MKSEKPGINEVLIQDSRQGRWIRFSNPLRVLVARQIHEVLPVLSSVEAAVESEGVSAAGYLGYESAAAFDELHATRQAENDLPLAWFGIYERGEEIFLPRCEIDFPAEGWMPSISREAYSQAIQRVRDYIAAGDTYQVNFSFRLRKKINAPPWQLFLHLISEQSAGYGAYIETDRWAVCSASPELFFRLHGKDLISRPMKGTISRGRWVEEDQERAESLRTSTKDRAENLMIVDMVRNDLGRVAETGSVMVEHLFEIEKYATLFQMTSTIRCRTGAGLVDIFKALFPPASITGAPKIRTMQIISKLEADPRGIYTGTIGFLAPGRRAQFNVAIRTALVDKSNGQAEYGVGGGIVWDSTEKSELEECYIKAAVLTRHSPKFDLLESLLWTPESGFPLLEKHLNRLESSASYFSLKFDKASVRDKIRKLASTLEKNPHKIRLLLQAGGDIHLEAHLLDDLPQPYRVCRAKNPIDTSDVLIYHKTTRREIYSQARKSCPELDDVLLWNEKGELTESTIANLIVELDGQLITPPVSSGLLPGICRANLLENKIVSTRIIRLEDLSRCTRVFLANAVRGTWEVEVRLPSKS